MKTILINIQLRGPVYKKTKVLLKYNLLNDKLEGRYFNY